MNQILSFFRSEEYEAADPQIKQLMVNPNDLVSLSQLCSQGLFYFQSHPVIARLTDVQGPGLGLGQGPELGLSSGDSDVAMETLIVSLKTINMAKSAKEGGKIRKQLALLNQSMRQRSFEAFDGEISQDDDESDEEDRRNVYEYDAKQSSEYIPRYLRAQILTEIAASRVSLLEADGSGHDPVVSISSLFRYCNEAIRCDNRCIDAYRYRSKAFSLHANLLMDRQRYFDEGSALSRGAAARVDADRLAERLEAGKL